MTKSQPAIWKSGLQHTIKLSIYDAHSNTQYAIRNTEYAIRNTQYAIRNISSDLHDGCRDTIHDFANDGLGCAPTQQGLGGDDHAVG